MARARSIPVGGKESILETPPARPRFPLLPFTCMNALLLTEYLKLELTPMPEPEIGPGDVLIRVRACGICGSDVHGFDGSTGRRIPPLVMGHEAAGGVAALRSSVSTFKVGESATFDSTISCGKCLFC